MPNAYPLEFPTWEKRSNSHQRAVFQVGFAQARDELWRELELLNAEQVVISMNVLLRRDGLPYANQREPDDPGVAVYFRWGGKNYCCACDQWERVKDNLRAIGLYTASIRPILTSRWGVRQAEQLLKVHALPEPSERPWWRVIGCAKTATLEEVKAAYRKAAAAAHPDVGGDYDRWHRLQDAYDAYLQELEATSHHFAQRRA
jgi:hypothetical protein